MAFERPRGGRRKRNCHKDFTPETRSSDFSGLRMRDGEARLGFVTVKSPAARVIICCDYPELFTWEEACQWRAKGLPSFGIPPFAFSCGRHTLFSGVFCDLHRFRHVRLYSRCLLPPLDSWYSRHRGTSQGFRPWTRGHIG